MSAQRIAAYLGRGLSLEERAHFEQHVFACAQCRQNLAEASDLMTPERFRWLARLVPLAAAATVPVLFWVGASEMSRPSGGEPMLRGPGTATQLAVVSPSDGVTADVDALVFVWRAASVDAHYVFTLMDADGDVVFTNGQTDTTLVLPRSVGLGEGSLYFWFVDALLDGAQSTSTGAQEFVVALR